jgi:homoserine kinase
MPDRAVTAFAPATVSNVACGFDVLGFPLERPGDEIDARIAPSGVTIENISGDRGRLPRDPSLNTAGIAASALLRRIGERRGVALTIRKGLPLASGLGGSAASAVAAVVAADALFGARAPIETLLASALEGEGLGKGAAHADNVAPCLYGGLVLVRVSEPLDVIRLPVPAGLTAVVVHPDLEIETSRARAMVGTEVPLADAVRQWGNLGGFVDALHRADFGQMARCLEDAIAEPRRASLVPGLAEIKRAALGAGALGCSLSGSGPSLFALCRGPLAARAVAEAIAQAVRSEVGGEPETYISPIASQGARIVSTCVS